MPLTASMINSSRISFSKPAVPLANSYSHDCTGFPRLAAHFSRKRTLLFSALLPESTGTARCASRLRQHASRGTVAVTCAVTVVKESCGAAKVQGSSRPTMEDAYKVQLESNFSFFGVFDGHGGAAVAQFLEKEFWPVYKKNLSGNLDPSTATTKTYLDVDQATLATPKGLFGALRERGIGGSKCGATAATAVILPSAGDAVPSLLVVANVGDSRVILSRGGQAVQLSFDHTPDVEQERQRIEKKNPNKKKPLVVNVGGAWRVGGLLALSRAFGDAYLKDWSDGNKDGASGGYGLTAEPTVKVEGVTSDDEWLILGTDGLFDHLSNQDVVDFCRNSESGEPLEGLAKKLASLAQERGSTDDISVIIARLK